MHDVFNRELTFKDSRTICVAMSEDKTIARKGASKAKEHLMITAQGGAALSPVQIEFNGLMKRLESARTKHATKQARLDQTLAISIRELMPLIEDLKRLNRDLVLTGWRILFENTKLTKKRRHWFGDLISGKASELLADPLGLSEADVAKLEAVIDDLGPCQDEQMAKEDEAGDFAFIRDMMERTAREAGVDLDLSDLDPNGDPAEFERALHERMRAASGAFERAPGSGRQRKPSKAQMEKERKKAEQDEAKKRDFKSLYKQLAKALHPDLETDPVLKQHKEVWMKRLTTAYAEGDLRSMLQLEMEWLGEEATNLSTAGDQKLRVYCMVLKEQIADLSRQTNDLLYQPQYGPLHRFIDPFMGTLGNPKTIKRELVAAVNGHRGMLLSLERDDSERRQMINEWADAHARASQDFDCPF